MRRIGFAISRAKMVTINWRIKILDSSTLSRFPGDSGKSGKTWDAAKIPSNNRQEAGFAIVNLTSLRRSRRSPKQLTGRVERVMNFGASVNTVSVWPWHEKDRTATYVSLWITSDKKPLMRHVITRRNANFLKNRTCVFAVHWSERPCEVSPLVAKGLFCFIRYSHPTPTR